MKGINEIQLQKIRKMTLKNQQRALNSQPFSRKRAYLNKQKCQQKIISMENQAQNLNQTGKLFDEDRQKFKTQELKKLSANPNIFDSVKILKQLDHVKVVIKELEQKNYKELQPKRSSNRKQRIISYSTRVNSAQSPKSIDNQYFARNKILKKYSDTQDKSERGPSVQIRAKTQQKVCQNSSSKQKATSMRMIKIKSNKNMLKVYNPFPTPMADFV